MSSKTLKRAVAPAMLALLLALAPAAQAASARHRAPEGLAGTRIGALSWLTEAWQWLTNVWGEEGSEIDPNGKPVQRTLGVGPGSSTPDGSEPLLRVGDEGSEIDPNG